MQPPIALQHFEGRHLRPSSLSLSDANQFSTDAVPHEQIQLPTEQQLLQQDHIFQVYPTQMDVEILFQDEIMSFEHTHGLVFVGEFDQYVDTEWEMGTGAETM